MRSSSHLGTSWFVRFALFFSLAFGTLWATARDARADKIPYHVKAYSHRGVTIQAREAFHKGKKVWFDLYVLNGTGKLLTVDKNLIQAKLADGRVLARAMGTFGKYAKANQLMPGQGHQLFVEFELGAMPSDLRIVVASAIAIDGRPANLPDLQAGPGFGQ